MVLKPSDFNLSSSNGCEFVDNVTELTEFSFSLYITNRLNMPVHYTNESATATLGAGIGGGGILIPLSGLRKSSDFTNNFTLVVSFPTILIPTNSTLRFLSIVLIAHVQEVSDVILLSLDVPLGRSYPTCSSTINQNSTAYSINRELHITSGWNNRSDSQNQTGT
jgi:hypothetical protein